jgi:hypothetical protein
MPVPCIHTFEIVLTCWRPKRIVARTTVHVCTIICPDGLCGKSSAVGLHIFSLLSFSCFVCFIFFKYQKSRPSVKYIVKLRSVILCCITLYRITIFALSCILLYYLLCIMYCAIFGHTMLGILFSSTLPSNILVTWYLHHGRPGLGGEFPVSTRSSMIAASAGPTRLVQSHVL